VVGERNKEKFGLEILKDDYKHWFMSWKWKITVLMGNVGSVRGVVGKRCF